LISKSLSLTNYVKYYMLYSVSKLNFLLAHEAFTLVCTFCARKKLFTKIVHKIFFIFLFKKIIKKNLKSRLSRLGLVFSPANFIDVHWLVKTP
jgi:hypothetical protein